MQGVFLDKGDGLFHGLRRITSDFDTVGDMGFVRSARTPELNPGIGKAAFAVLAEERHSTDGRRLASLVFIHPIAAPPDPDV